MLKPKAWIDLGWVRHLNWPLVRTEIFAGATGAAVVLPQAVAFATIAGLPPQYGVYTAMAPPIIAALFGSSAIMVSGPSTAMSAIVFSAIATASVPGSSDYIRNAILMTLFVGIIQLAFASLRAGRIAGFVSPSVMTGFTAGAAVLIAVSQIGPALGFVSNASNLLERIALLAAQAPDQTNAAAVAVSILSLVLVAGFRKYLPKWPGFLIALGAGALLAWVLGGSAAGLRMVDPIPVAVPSFDIPEPGNLPVSELFRRSFAVAMIGLLSSVAIGRSMAQRTSTPFSADREIVSQGLANLVGSFFQSYPGSGSFTRSAVNLECGARTPLAAMFSAFFLLLITLIFGPYVEHVPVAAIAGVVLYVAWRLIDKEELLRLARLDRTEFAVMAVTFLAGIFGGLEIAVYVGVLVSLLIFLAGASQPSIHFVAPGVMNGRRFLAPLAPETETCPAIAMVRVEGALFFGSSETLESRLEEVRRSAPEKGILVLLLKGVSDLDASAADVLVREAEKRATDGALIVVASSARVQARLARLGLEARLGPGRVFHRQSEAIASAVELAALRRCATCSKRVFIECGNARSEQTDLLPA